MTLVVEGPDTVVEQVIKQLYKMINVRKVSDVTDDPTVDRELALIKVSAKATTRSEIMQIVDIFRGKDRGRCPGVPDGGGHRPGGQDRVSRSPCCGPSGSRRWRVPARCRMVRGSIATREMTGAGSNGHGKVAADVE